MNRERIVHEMLDPTGRGLEIGPGYRPLFPKSKGFRVETVDHLPTEALRRKFEDMGVDMACLEEVDHVWQGEPLEELIPERGAYDFVFASHVMEHLPDPLGFINACDALLAEGGVVVAIIPDKRFCFDALRPIASTGDLIQAHLERRTRHPAGKLFDQVAYRALRRGKGSWRSRTLGPYRFRYRIEDARSQFERDAASPEYADVHGWQFVPSSFRLALLDLHAAGLTPMREVAFNDMRGQRDEFIVAFARWGAGCPIDRLTLCRRILREQRAGMDDVWTSARGFLSTVLAAGRRLLGG